MKPVSISRHIKVSGTADRNRDFITVKGISLYAHIHMQRPKLMQKKLEYYCLVATSLNIETNTFHSVVTYVESEFVEFANGQRDVNRWK